MKLSKLLKALFGFFVLKVEDGKIPDDVPEDDVVTGEELVDIPADDDADIQPEDVPQDDEPQHQSRGSRDIAELRRRTQEAEQRAARAEQIAQENARRLQGPTPDQQRYMDEEQKLRDPNLDPTERWQIESNRILRQQHAAANQALMEARDTKDSAEYERLCAKNTMADKYRDRVEAFINEQRQAGQMVPPRAEVFALLAGRDIRDGKFQKGASPKSISPSKRGATPGARSDVSGSRGMSDAQKRDKRLEGVTI